MDMPRTSTPKMLALPEIGDGKTHPLKAWRERQIVKPEQWGRPARCMTLAEAAALGGWQTAMWHAWENGQRLPSRTNMPAVCRLTGLEPNDFYQIDGMPFSEWRRRRRAPGVLAS